MSDLGNGRTPTRWKPGPDVLAERLEDQVVLVHLRSNRMFELNRTGARMWELLEAGGDVEEIRRSLRAEFAVDAERLEREMDALLAELSRERLIIDGDR
jgi:hypothetical protein